MKERLYWACIGRPILGYLVKDRPIILRPPNYYVVKHTKFCLYWRDPYGLRENSGRHLSDWGKLSQAWKFGSQELAENLLAQNYEVGIIESIPFDS